MRRQKRDVPPMNPWGGEQPLHQVEGYTPEDALREVSHFLLNWPGTQTPIADLERRHNRFIQIIGGYPELNGRYPLDWPLHPESIRALRLSYYLDTIPGSIDSSLRSVILERDLHYRRKMGEISEDVVKKRRNLVNFNKECVGLLLAGLRPHYNTDRVENGTDTDILNRQLTSDEECLLISLHSLDSEKMSRIWPWSELALQNTESQLYPPQPNKDKPSGKEIGNIFREFGRDSEEYRAVIELQKEWVHWEESNVDNLVEIRFEYKFIQKWMYKHWLKCWNGQREVSDSIGQRLLRGLSSLCELGMSRVRRRIIREFGVGSIIVDGGGRISFVVQEEDAKKGMSTVQNSFERMFLLDQNDASYPFLEQDIQEALRHHLFSRPDVQKQSTNTRQKLTAEDFENHLGEDFVRQCMPPRRVYLYESAEENPLPYIVKAPTSEKCNLCSCEIENWQSLASRISNGKIPICMMHRLIFIVGTNQRIRDSILRQSETAMGYQIDSVPDNQRKRRVTKLLTMDGNSIGILFGKNIDSVGPQHRFDILRRRSFRFNAFWYDSLHGALESSTQFGADRIAAWICAGDDLILAQYGDSDDYGTSPMDSFIECFNNYLINYLETGLFLTFAGGVASRKEGGWIRQLFQESMNNEIIAKHLWKNNVVENEMVEYVTTNDGQKKYHDEQLEPMETDWWLGNNNGNGDGPPSLIVVDTAGREPRPNPNEDHSRQIIIYPPSEEKEVPMINDDHLEKKDYCEYIGELFNH